MKLFLKISVIAGVMTFLGACGSDFEWFPDPDSNTPAANTAPVANAGGAQSVLIGDTVALDGNASSDANGDTLTYSWTLTRPSGSDAVLSSTIAESPTFIADVVGVYNLSLIVNDGKDSSPAATVTVTAYNSPPTAYAGLDQNVIAGTPVQLDGSGSSGAILGYNWKFNSRPPNASGVLLSSATVVNPTFTTTITGIYEIELIVKDRLVNSLPVIVKVTITPSNIGSITVTW